MQYQGTVISIAALVLISFFAGPFFIWHSLLEPPIGQLIPVSCMVLQYYVTVYTRRYAHICPIPGDMHLGILHWPRLCSIPIRDHWAYSHGKSVRHSSLIQVIYLVHLQLSYQQSNGHFTTCAPPPPVFGHSQCIRRQLLHCSVHISLSSHRRPYRYP